MYWSYVLMSLSLLYSETQQMSCVSASDYDVFLSFRGFDTRRTFISFLYKALIQRKIRTFKDDKELENGQRISSELNRAIGDSKIAVVVISPTYAASPWCLGELVKIMDFEKKGKIIVMPIFYGVNPCHVRRQSKRLAKQFKKHEEREKDEDKVDSWKRALTALANISGDCSSEWDDDAELVDGIVDKISKNLMIVTTPINRRQLVGIDNHMKAINALLDLNSNKNVKVIGIWARGCEARSALASKVYHNICQEFESHCFLERISQDCHMSHLHEEYTIRNQKACLRKLRVKNQKVLLVADDVNELKHLDALAEEFNCFGPGSVVIITTQDKKLFDSFGIKLVYEQECLSFLEVTRQIAFKKSVIRMDSKIYCLQEKEEVKTTQEVESFDLFSQSIFGF